MRVDARIPGTDIRFSFNMHDADYEAIRRSKARTTDNHIKAEIRNLPLSQKAKRILTGLLNECIKITKVAAVTGKVAAARSKHVVEVSLPIGKAILTYIIDFFARWQGTIIGATIGYLIGGLISTIPFVGWLLAPTIKPLFLALGLAIGGWSDLKDAALKREIKGYVNEMFRSLKSMPVPA